MTKTQTSPSVVAGVLHTTGLIKTTIGDRECYATQEQIDTLAALEATQKGGFATVHGYKPTSNYDKSPTVNINFISRFSTQALYQRKIEALKSLKFEDLTITAPKLLALSEDKQRAQFHTCIGKMLESMTKTLEGDRSDAHRQAHDTFYAKSAMGVKVHFETVKGKDGTELVLHNGLPKVKSVMLSVIEIGRKTIEEGVYKTVNSGPKVLMDNAINKAIKSKTVSMKTISLKSDNYEKVTIGGDLIEPEVAASIQTQVSN
jgi:hypothetical protein